MRVEIAAVLGLAAGAAGTYAALASRTPKTVVVEVPGPTVEAPTQALLRPAEGAGFVPGRPPADPVGSGVFALDLRAWSGLEVAKAEKEDDVKNVWRAIGRTYARSGLLEDWMRLADSALAADRGYGPGVVWLATEFPAPQRLLALEALLRAHPELRMQVHASTMGQAYLLCGAKEKGFALLVESLVATKGEDGMAIQALTNADAERTDSALWAIASEWSSIALQNVAGHLSNHARADLAKRWNELIARKAGPGPTPAEVAALHAEYLREAEDTAREAPEQESNWEAVAVARKEAGDRKGAFDAYAKAIEVGGIEVAFFEAMVSLDAARALPIVERAAKEDGGDDLLHELTHAYLELGRGREAAEAYFRMREPDEDATLAHEFAGLAPEAALAAVERRAKRRGGAMDNDGDVKGTALLALGRSEAAFETYLRVSEASRSRLAYAGLARADAARAIPILEALLREGDLSEKSQVALADACRRVGRKEEAAALCEAVLKENDENFDAMRERALLDPEKGLPRLRAAAEQFAENSFGWIALGDALRELNKPVEAREAYERAVATGNRGPDVLARLASLR